MDQCLLYWYRVVVLVFASFIVPFVSPKFCFNPHYICLALASNLPDICQLLTKNFTISFE